MGERIVKAINAKTKSKNRFSKCWYIGFGMMVILGEGMETKKGDWTKGRLGELD